METLGKLEFHGELDDWYLCPKGKLEQSKISRRTSYVQDFLERVYSNVIGPFIDSY